LDDLLGEATMLTTTKSGTAMDGSIPIPGMAQGSAPPLASGLAAAPLLSATAAEAAQAAELAALVTRMAAGDQGALERLYDLTLSRVFALARRICTDEALAEEVTEDAYFQAWREAGRFDPARAPAIGWLLMITRSRALDALRRADPALLADDPHALAGEDGHDEADPLGLLDSLQRESDVRRALETLPARDRQIVALAFLRGLTHAEIAEAMRLPLGTVKTAVRRSLRALRAPLAAWAPAATMSDWIDEVDDEHAH
jgi:RNA polymerase sigma factor (sigma-70 family)